MAVATKTTRLLDRTNKRAVDVHYIHVTKSNRKGAAEAIGGTLVVEGDSWWIELLTTVNGKKVKLIIMNNQFVFRTSNNTRWQVANREAFNKRFSVE